jgi:hypothetical protein
MKMVKSLMSLSGKRVEIQSKAIGTGMPKSYKGVVVSLYLDGQCTFIELDSGELINTLYIANITIVG